MGLNLHTLYDTLYKDQNQWNTPQAGGSFHQGLPYWSKVEKLTIHLKTVLDPTAADPARRPISQIDMALSEGVTRKFVECMVTIDGVPNDARRCQCVPRRARDAGRDHRRTRDARRPSRPVDQGHLAHRRAHHRTRGA